MKLFTRTQFEQLIHNGSVPHLAPDPLPVIKLHMPGTGCAWLLTSLEPDNPLMGYGLCDLGLGCPELGSVDLSELARIKLPLDIQLETDDEFIGLYPLSVYADAARAIGRITDDDQELRRHRPPYRNPLRPV